MVEQMNSYDKYLENEEDNFQFDLDNENNEDNESYEDDEYVDEFGVTIYHLPSYSTIPPTAQELANWAAFNRELDLTFIPDWERDREWM
jgi:hypothetical protein